MNGINTYKNNAVGNAPPGRLIVMLYEGAVKFLNKAIDELNAGRFPEASQYVNRAVDIIQELDTSLDTEAGGEIAGNLRSMYSFMVKHLLQARIKRDGKMIREVMELLEELAEGWRAIAS